MISFQTTPLLSIPYCKSANLLNSFSIQLFSISARICVISYSFLLLQHVSFSMHFLSSHFHTQLNTFLFFSISHFLTFPLFPFFSVQFQSISYFYLFYFSLLYLISWEIERIFYADSFLYNL